uniref:Uncharacterized protein n=1 Tax=Caenorhabditis tropicalis TaxID=1561998 RepID=A0A1I7TZD2_9PELO
MKKRRIRRQEKKGRDKCGFRFEMRGNGRKRGQGQLCVKAVQISPNAAGLKKKKEEIGNKGIERERMELLREKQKMKKTEKTMMMSTMMMMMMMIDPMNTTLEMSLL